MSSINVIGSGLDVQSIVDQLIQIERAPISNLQKLSNNLQSKIKALQSFNTKLSALLDKLNNALFKDETAPLSVPSGFAQRLARSVFAARKSSSSDESVVAASVDKNAALGTYAITVGSLARAKTAASANFADMNSTKTGTGTLTIQIGTRAPVEITVDSANNTLEGIRDSINGANAGVNAAIINDGSSSPYRLLITSKDTGTTNAFTVTENLSGGPTLDLVETQTAVDAQLTVNGISLSKSSNTVSDVISGVSLTLKATTATPVEITVEKDTDAAVSALKELIAAYNEVNTFANSQSRYDPDKRTAGILSGDTTLRNSLSQITGLITREVTNSSTGLHYIGEVGLNFNSDGSLSLDETKLRNALASDATAVAALFLGGSSALSPGASPGPAADEGDGTLMSLRSLLRNVTDPLSGPIHGATDAFNNTIKGLQDRIGEYEDRLLVRRERLTEEFSRADQALKMLSVLQSQLSNQLGSLSKLG